MQIPEPVLLVIGFSVSFLVCFLAMPTLIAKLRKEGIVGRDMLKPRKVMVPECGGILKGPRVIS